MVEDYLRRFKIQVECYSKNNGGRLPTVYVAGSTVQEAVQTTVGDVSQENRDLELAWIFLAGWRRLLAWIFLARFLSAAAIPEPPLKRF